MKKNDSILKINKAALVLILVISFIVAMSSQWALAEEKRDTIHIGLILDGDAVENIPLITLLNEELKVLLGAKYNIGIREQDILGGQWSFAKIQENYNRLAGDPSIDIIIGAGAITGSIIARKERYDKPVISIGIIDPVIQGISPVVNNKSGIHNLTYVMANKSIIQDLETFHRVYPYKTLGFVYYNELVRTITAEGKKSIRQLMDRKNSMIINIPMEKGAEDVLKNLDRVDALYISYLGKFEGETKQELIRELNNRKIPAFGSSIKDAQWGMLAAMAPQEIEKKIIRRISLNIEAILEGKDPSQLDVFTEFEKKLTINMKTADQIDFSPKFTILSQAELINENYIRAERRVDLVEVMEETLEKNLDLEVSMIRVENAKYDISRAKTDYYPSLSAGLNGVVIDRERAEKSGGTQAQRTTGGNLNATQLIYSDQVLKNIDSQKHLYQASRLDHKNTRLDVVLRAVEAYFTILKTKTSRKVLNDNVDLIRKNLKIARQREVIGYSGRSDVLRWKSQLATASTELLEAKQSVLLAKNDLNRILNRHQEEHFHIEDTSLDDRIFSIYSANAIEKYIDNQKSLDIFTDFFIDQCIENSVEIKELNENTKSLEQALAALKQKHYLPTISFSANHEQVFSRNGEGSHVTGVDPVDDSWDAGIYLSLPFYEGGSRRVDIKKIKLDISGIHKEKLILAQAIENNARQRLSDVMVKMVNLELSREAATYAKENLELVRDAYTKGRVSVVELADAQNNALTGDLNAVGSTYEYLVSLFRMERVYGHFSLLLPLDGKERITHKFKAYLNQKIQ
jgi:outer membrane protein TolC/ABC-type uncharacterized transport system substrate-binding protein